MKYLMFFTIFILFLISYSHGCELGMSVQHINPDGSVGGFKSLSAKVAPSVYVDKTSRVCDSAWIDGNAKILNYSIVKNNAWVRSNSIIKNFATVSDSAYISGSSQRITYIRDHAKIYGNSKVLEGSDISGRSEVYGNVTISSSRLSAASVACESFVVEDKDIEDDYYCSGDDSLSRISLKLDNYEENFFNELKTSVRIVASSGRFVRDSSIFQIFINGSAVENNDFKINSDILNIETNNYLKEGWNEIEITGRDELGKIIKRDFQFIVGFEERSFSISNSSLIVDENLKLTAKFLLDGVDFYARTYYVNGIWSIKGIPSNIQENKFVLSGVGEQTFIYEAYDQVKSLPLTLTSTVFRASSDLNANFENGLLGWHINDSSKIEWNSNSEGNYVAITPSSVEKVEIIKFLTLSSIDKAVEIQAYTPGSISPMFSGAEKIQVIIASKTEKKIESYELTDVDLMRLSQSSLGTGTFSFSNSLNIKNQIAVVIRLPAQTGKVLNELPAVNLKGVQKISKDIVFNPENFFILNPVYPSSPSKPAKPVILDGPYGKHGCTNPHFNFSNPRAFKKYSESISFFSGGPNHMFGDLENRIFGEVSFNGVLKSEIDDVQLMIFVDGTYLDKVPLAQCALKEFNSLTSNSFSFKHNDNVARYAFTIGSEILSRMALLPGSDVSLSVQVKLKSSNKILYSKPKNLKALASPLLDKSKQFYGTIDYYGTNEGEMVRTGGDKWFLPAYKFTIESILNSFYNKLFAKWRLGDGSKLNGGFFPEHSKVTHNDGKDADIQFNLPNVNFFEYKNATIPEELWLAAINEIEELLTNISQHYNVIRDIYVTKSHPEIDPYYLEVGLKNRCLNEGQSNSRFLDFSKELGSGSLLRDTLNHHHHLHVRFNPVNKSGLPLQNFNFPPTNIDLDDFNYHLEIDENDKELFSITPKNPLDIKNIKVLWRYQDIEGFRNFNMLVDFGSILGPVEPKDLYKKALKKKGAVRFIYLVAANVKVQDDTGRADGSCIQKLAVIELPAIINKKRFSWTYNKESSGKMKLKSI